MTRGIKTFKKTFLKCSLIVVLVISFAQSAFCTTTTQEKNLVTAQDQVSSNAGVEVFTYNPAGRRDPFEPLVNKIKETSRISSIKPRGPLQKFELTQFRLLAVLIIKGRPMAMVKSPDGKSYPVKIGNEIGRYGGRVVNIETKVVDRDSSGKRIEKSPDRLVIEEAVRNNFTGKESVEYRYLSM